MQKQKAYKALAVAHQAYLNCVKSDNVEWEEKWLERIKEIIKNLPSGSGLDGNTEFDWDKSKRNRLIINSEFHVMDENGMYDGWIYFRIILTPDLQFGLNLKIIGNFSSKYQHIKDYLSDLFYDALNQIV